MNGIRRSRVITWFTPIALLISLCVGAALSGHTHAQSERAMAELQTIRSESLGPDWSTEPSNQGEKMSPDLRDQVDSSVAGDGFGTMATKEKVVRAIVQLNQQPSGKLNGLLNSNSVSEKGRFYYLNSRVIEAPLSVLSQIASFKEVKYISLDRDV